MKRVILKYQKKNLILFDANIDNKGTIKINRCIDNIYLELIRSAINEKYELEFEDKIFKIDEKDVFRNIEKLKKNPLYKDKLEIINI
jgi:hypothetical protein